MKKLFSSRRGFRLSAGLPPGDLTDLKQGPPAAPTIRYFLYNKEYLEEGEISRPEELKALTSGDKVLWVHFMGLPDENFFRYFMDELGIHPLILEDIRNGEHRPKTESTDDFLLIILRLLTLRQHEETLQAEQISILLGKSRVFSFQENTSDPFSFLRERLRAGKGRVRSLGADYLAYALMDIITDNDFVIMEHFEDAISALENELAEDPSKETLAAIHALKRSLMSLRHSVWPQREVVRGLEREGHELIGPDLEPFLRDLYDHTIQVIDTVESFRDVTTGMMDLYMSGVSNRMNEIMKVLTIISTIFIPLSFIAGLYGMNFDPAASPFNMPELSWRFGYFLVLGVMGLTALGMIWYFKRKKWL